jgi:hypothetical protein
MAGGDGCWAPGAGVMSARRRLWTSFRGVKVTPAVAATSKVRQAGEAVFPARAKDDAKRGGMRFRASVGSGQLQLFQFYNLQFDVNFTIEFCLVRLQGTSCLLGVSPLA